MTMRTSGATADGLRRWIAALLLTLLSGCGYYSFSGASIPPELDTIAIPLAELDAATPLPSLPDELTRLLADRFVRQTRLRLENDEASADAVLQARITGYRNEPTAVGDDRAQRTRITITVAVRYAAREAPQPYLDRTFTAFSDFDALADGLDGEAQAAESALRQIADDVFTAATSNW